MIVSAMMRGPLRESGMALDREKRAREGRKVEMGERGVVGFEDEAMR